MKTQCTFCGACDKALKEHETGATLSPNHDKFLISHELALLISGGPKGLIAFCPQCGYDFDSAYTRELIKAMPALCPYNVTGN